MAGILTMCFGQAGVQLGDTFFQQLAQESGIQPDGLRSEDQKHDAPGD